MESNRYFAAVCPKGHKEVYDKAEICERITAVLGQDEGEYVVVCPARLEDGTECRHRFKVKIDCEGYR